MRACLSRCKPSRSSNGRTPLRWAIFFNASDVAAYPRSVGAAQRACLHFPARIALLRRKFAAAAPVAHLQLHARAAALGLAARARGGLLSVRFEAIEAAGAWRSGRCGGRRQLLCGSHVSPVQLRWHQRYKTTRWDGFVSLGDTEKKV